LFVFDAHFCIPEISSSVLMTSLLILSSFVHPLTFPTQRISAAARPVQSRCHSVLLVWLRLCNISFASVRAFFIRFLTMPHRFWNLFIFLSKPVRHLNSVRIPNNQTVSLVITLCRLFLLRTHSTPTCSYLKIRCSRKQVAEFGINYSYYQHCATNRKVAGSIPDGVIDIFH
jgi:hypothetical protein